MGVGAVKGGRVGDVSAVKGGGVGDVKGGDHI